MWGCGSVSTGPSAVPTETPCGCLFYTGAAAGGSLLPDQEQQFPGSPLSLEVRVFWSLASCRFSAFISASSERSMSEALRVPQRCPGQVFTQSPVSWNSSQHAESVRRSCGRPEHSKHGPAPPRSTSNTLCNSSLWLCSSFLPALLQGQESIL